MTEEEAATRLSDLEGAFRQLVGAAHRREWPESRTDAPKLEDCRWVRSSAALRPDRRQPMAKPVQPDGGS